MDALSGRRGRDAIIIIAVLILLVDSSITKVIRIARLYRSRMTGGVSLEDLLVLVLLLLEFAESV